MSAQSDLVTEADVVRTLAEGTYTLQALYEECLASADVARDNGLKAPDVDHPTDQVWRRRVRNALQTMRASGHAKRIGRSVWAIRGTRERPRQLILIASGGICTDIELRVQDAVALLATLDEPVDLVLCDPPYALERGRSASSLRRTYRRDHGKVIGGYVDVPVEEYEQFTHAWVGAAAAALRPGGQLAAITDVCVGGGTSAIEARALGRRFIGGDVNPDAVRFTAARLLSEHAWREEVEPSLFPARLAA